MGLSRPEVSVRASVLPPFFAESKGLDSAHMTGLYVAFLDIRRHIVSLPDGAKVLLVERPRDDLTVPAE